MAIPSFFVFDQRTLFHWEQTGPCGAYWLTGPLPLTHVTTMRTALRLCDEDILFRTGGFPVRGSFTAGGRTFVSAVSCDI